MILHISFERSCSSHSSTRVVRIGPALAGSDDQKNFRKERGHGNVTRILISLIHLRNNNHQLDLLFDDCHHLIIHYNHCGATSSLCMRSNDLIHNIPKLCFVIG